MKKEVRVTIEIAPEKQPFVTKGVKTVEGLKSHGYQACVMKKGDEPIRVEFGPPVKVWLMKCKSNDNRPAVVASWSDTQGWSFDELAMSEVTPELDKAKFESIMME